MRDLLPTAVETARQWADALRYALRMVGPSSRRLRPEKRVLVLTRGLPPTLHGGSFRQLALLRALHQAGWHVDALTDMGSPTPSSAGMALLAEIPEGVHVHRWPAASRRGSDRFSPRLSGGFSSVRQILDPASQIPGVPSIVLASGPPFAEFIAAAQIARWHRVHCVLDYRDEWTTSSFAFVDRGPGDTHWEALCLRAATTVVFATDSMRTHYLRTFPVLARRITATIRNGWDDTGVFGLESVATRPDRSGRAVIGFFGLLGEHWDFPEFTQTLAATLDCQPALGNRIQISVYGRVSPENTAAIEALGRPSLFHLHGLVPHQDAQRAMAACEALIVFNSPRLSRVLPGKLYEYVAARRPILLYGSGGEMEDLLKTVPGVTIAPRGQPVALVDALQRILSGGPATEIAAAPPDYALALHRNQRDREWIQLLDALLAGGRRPGPARFPEGDANRERAAGG